MTSKWLFAGTAMLVTAPATAQTPPKPRLVIAIAVDQLSTDLFERYRPTFTGGLKTLSGGVVFASGYQSHAATETCPGHATILSGIRPGRAGIIGNDWYGTRAANAPTQANRDEIYCVGDENHPDADKGTVVSFKHTTPDFKTLGDRLKDKNGARTRVFAVAGKDRAATLMAGRKADQIWWYEARKPGFATFVPNDPSYGNVAATPPAIVATVNAEIKAKLETPPAAPTLTPDCAALVKPLLISGNQKIGDQAVVPNKSASAFRATPALDDATLTIAEDMMTTFDLGRKGHTDVLAISLSVTDYVGHGYGTDGPEMCMQIAALDARLGAFLKAVEDRGVPFIVTLTADHGGHDVPERASPGTGRSPYALGLEGINQALRTMLGIKDRSVPVVTTKGIGDLWLTDAVPQDKRAQVTAFLKGAIAGLQGVEAVFTRDEIMATPMPTTAPDTWTLLERVRASYMDGRSGALFVALKEGLSPIPIGGPGFVATHGSIWDYDRRVPILFWWKGARAFDAPDAVETVDILPTLASLIGLKVPSTDIDGRCRDIVAGPASNCR
jgi:predicted AlkP superfamily pyrophosphatase or phosphodiesterase